VTGVLLLSLGTSTALTAFLTWLLLPALKKLKGETIREDVPERHRLKAGTPTMGGISFVIAAPLAAFFVTAAYFPQSLADIGLFCGAMVSYALLGFADDWAKLKTEERLENSTEVSSPNRFGSFVGCIGETSLGQPVTCIPSLP